MRMSAAPMASTIARVAAQANGRVVCCNVCCSVLQCVAVCSTAWCVLQCVLLCVAML